MTVQRPINPEILRDQVVADCGIELAELFSNTRRAKVVFARAIICTVLRQHTMLSLPEINGVIRSRKSSHAIVLDAIQRVRSGGHDDDAKFITGLPCTALEYANYCFIRAGEASLVESQPDAAHQSAPDNTPPRRPRVPAKRTDASKARHKPALAAAEPAPKDQPSPVYDEVLVALSITPKKTAMIQREVEIQLGRKMHRRTITRALRTAEQRGAAMETVLGWAEPIDDLSPHFAGDTPCSH